MKIELKAAGAVAAALVGLGAAGTAIAMSGHNHGQQPSQVVIRQDAATISQSTATVHVSARPTITATGAAPVVKKPATVKEATVTEPTNSDPTDATAPAQEPAGKVTDPATQGPNGGPLPSMATYAPPPPPPPVLPGPTSDRSATPAPTS